MAVLNFDNAPSLQRTNASRFLYIDLFFLVYIPHASDAHGVPAGQFLLTHSRR
jgi:hypothetical protein